MAETPPISQAGYHKLPTVEPGSATTWRDQKEDGNEMIVEPAIPVVK
jgi:hypothetical protein